MYRNMIGIIGSVILAVWIIGCSQNSVIPMGESHLDKNWGRSYETAKHNQILNPNAGKEPEPVEGLEGRAAERIMDGYIKGGDSQQQPQTEFGVVNIKQ